MLAEAFSPGISGFGIMWSRPPEGSQAQHAVIGIYLAQICGNWRLERDSLFSIPISLIHHRP
jgi:hypothetical protein